MTEVKQILVVDDHFEMLEFLRSMLELSNQDYEVLAVPSAEEGLLEVRRAQFDLVITDVRLPGMSGFDLVRQLQKFARQTPVIMITAYSSHEGRKEAEDLGVYRYFQKPLDTDNVLTAVHTALHGAPVVLSSPAGTSLDDGASSQIQKRLETLRTDTGAVQLLLATVEGEILYTVGKPHQMDLANLARIIARTVQDGFLLAEQLQSVNPFTLQYHAGEKVELYCANIGQRYFLSIFFDATSRRGRIGTIWVFTQRAIRELEKLLPAMETTTAVAPEPAPLTKGKGSAETVETAVDLPDELSDEIDLLPVVEFSPIEAGESELADLLAAASAPADSTPAVDLNAFWDDALTQQDAQDISRGLTMEEARQRGLIQADLDVQESEE